MSGWKLSWVVASRFLVSPGNFTNISFRILTYSPFMVIFCSFQLHAAETVLKSFMLLWVLNYTHQILLHLI